MCLEHYVRSAAQAESLDLYEQCRRECSQTGHVGGEANTVLHMSEVHMDLGNIRQAQALADEGLALRTAQGEPGQIGVALMYVGKAASTAGDYAQALDALQQAVSLTREHYWPAPGAALKLLAEAQLLAGDYAAALDSARQGADTFEASDHLIGRVRCLEVTGRIHEAAGDVPEAVASWQQASQLPGDRHFIEAPRLRANLARYGG
jgi:tetratricopeptide (TPR) repeat protein